MAENKGMKLWQTGLIICVLAALANGLLIRFGIGGLLRELMRLVILAGLGVFLFGVIKAFQKQ